MTIANTTQPVNRQNSFHPLHLARKLNPNITNEDISNASSQIIKTRTEKVVQPLKEQGQGQNLLAQLISKVFVPLMPKGKNPEKVFAQRDIKGQTRNHLDLAEHKITGLKLLLKDNPSDIEAKMSLARILTELTEDPAVDTTSKQKHLSEAQAIYKKSSQTTDSAQLLHNFADNNVIEKTSIRALERLLSSDHNLSKTDKAKVQWAVTSGQLEQPKDTAQVEKVLREICEVIPLHNSSLIRFLKEHKNSEGIKEVYANWIKLDPEAIDPYFGLARLILNRSDNKNEPKALMGIMGLGHEEQNPSLKFRDRSEISDSEFQLGTFCLKRAAELREKKFGKVSNQAAGISFMEPHYFDKFKEHYQLAA